MSSDASRRDFLKLTGAIAAGAAVGGLLPTTALADPSPDRRRSLRIAHFTDMHIQPELAADEGVATAFRHVQALADKPSLILTGGDTVMDSFASDADRTQLQWDLWKKVVQAECTLPIESCLGNHDVWGWNKSHSKTTGNEPRWGKRWACEMFAREKPYRSFDRDGWHFVLLDSIIPHEDGGYEGRLDDEQFAWLQSDLAATKPETPVLVMSHIPILAACVIAGNRKRDNNHDALLPHNLMHTDVARITNLFWKHKNVKLCLSGHIHQRDRIDYDGVTYLCNGAVCGGWWKGPNGHTKAGYAVIDLFNDGTFTNEYVDYGWKARV